MADWSDLKAAVAQVIKTNGKNEITGQVLQNTLNTIIDNVGENATYAGIATPSTNPGAPDGNVFYFATEAGTYSNFGGKILETGLNMLLWGGVSWNVTNVMSIVQDVGSNEDSVISQKVVTNLVSEYNVSVNHPTEGIDGSNKYTLETAIAKVPAGLRNVGIKCSFLDEDGLVETWEYQGVNFLNIDKWIKIGGNRINEIYNTIGDFCAFYKESYKQLDENGSSFSLGNSQYRITDYIDVSHINALYYNIKCNPTNKSAVIAAYSKNKEFIQTNSIISEESTLGSIITGTWIKLDNTCYIRISFLQQGESSCIVTSVNDRYALELSKKLEHVDTDNIENGAITPQKLDRVYASYSFGEDEVHSNYVYIDKSISALSIKSEHGNVTINNSNKNLCTAQLTNKANVEQGISEFTISNVSGAFVERKFSTFFLPKGNYFVKAKIETLSGDNPTYPSIYLRNFKSLSGGQNPTLINIGNSWNETEVLLEDDSEIDNVSVVFSLANAINNVSKYHVQILISRKEGNDSAGDWIASTLSSIDISENEYTQVIAEDEGLIWSNDGSYFYYKTGTLGNTSHILNQVQELDNRVSYIEEKINIGQTNKIVSWGDSLVQSAGSSTGKPQSDTNSDVSWPAVLGRLTGFESINMGVGGESSWQVAIRQGAMSLIGKLDNIPENTEEIDIELVGQEQNSVYLNNVWEYTNNNYLKLPNMSSKGINPVIICGIEGNIKQYTRYRLTLTSDSYLSGTLKIAVGYSDANLTEGYVHDIIINEGMSTSQVANAIASLTVDYWDIHIDDSIENSVIFSYEKSDNNNGLKITDAGSTNVEASVISIGRYTFSRLSPGDKVTMNYPVHVITNGANMYRDHIMIIWMGANDAIQIDSIYRNQEGRYDRAKAMVDFINDPKRYIIISHLENGLKSDENAVKMFGSHYINISRWIAKYGIEYANSIGANIVPSENDKNNISNLNIPQCFKVDGIHLNYWGYQCVARAVYECGKALMYW